VYIVNVDGTGKQRLTTATEGREYDPHWSPDGTKIVYNGNTVASVPPASGTGSAATATAAGQSETDAGADTGAGDESKSTPGFGWMVSTGMVLLGYLFARRAA
jgi:Tol biopolymer transport system component